MRAKLSVMMVAGLVALASQAFAQRPLGDSAVFATVPAVPGFPEGIAVRGNRVYVTGPAHFGIFTPSAVWPTTSRPALSRRPSPSRSRTRAHS